MTFLTLAFAGTRHLRSVDVAVVMDEARAEVMRPDYRCFITGGCIGVDGVVGRYVADLRRDAGHLVIVPADRSKVDPWWVARDVMTLPAAAVLSDNPRKTVIRLPGPGLYVYEMPDESTYRDRDTAMVVSADRLRGFAEFPSEAARSKRSGTWLTARIAEVHQRPTRMTVLRP